MTKQIAPITDTHSSIMAGSGSYGVFICTNSTPFDSSTLTGDDKGKVGVAYKLITRDGADATVSTITANGVSGDSAALAGTWLSGEGFAIEVTAMTVAAGTIAFIYLKETNNKILP